MGGGSPESICAPVPINIDHLSLKRSFFTCNLTRTVLLFLSTSFDCTFSCDLIRVPDGVSPAQLKGTGNTLTPPRAALLYALSTAVTAAEWGALLSSGSDQPDS